MNNVEENKPIDGAEYITLEETKHLKLPFLEGLAAGCPSPAIDYQHESLDLNEKCVHHPEASYFVRVHGESMIVLGSQQYTAKGGKGKAEVFKDSIKHDFRSPCYTIRWSDIPEAT